MNAKEVAEQCEKHAEWAFRQDMLCPHFGTETFEAIIQSYGDERVAEATAPLQAEVAELKTAWAERVKQLKEAQAEVERLNVLLERVRNEHEERHFR